MGQALAVVRSSFTSLSQQMLDLVDHTLKTETLKNHLLSFRRQARPQFGLS